ncbi:MAG: helix-turn-helix transcriptional regulator [Streptosporangiaceae bacterium]
MSAESSPTVRKLRLGMQLRKLRARSGATMLEAAASVARTDSTISRLETGHVCVSQNVLEKLCDLYAASPEERNALRTLARQARQRGWWQPYGESLLPGFSTYLGLETEAATVSVYAPGAVPGFLQSADYASALAAGNEEDGRIRRAINEGRRLRLTGKNLEVVLHEGGLRQRIGGSEVMAGQLRLLAARADLRVVPFEAGAYAALSGSGFTVLSTPLGGGADYAAVYVESLVSGTMLDRQSQVEHYQEAFRRLPALDPARSRALIVGIVEELTG